MADDQPSTSTAKRHWISVFDLDFLYFVDDFCSDLGLEYVLSHSEGITDLDHDDLTGPTSVNIVRQGKGEWHWKELDRLHKRCSYGNAAKTNENKI